MKTKIKRQGLSVSLAELTKLKMDLIKQTQELQKKLKMDDWQYVDYNQRFQIGIINKTPECSDTWKLEL